MLKDSESPQKMTAVVLGAGIAGCLTALKLASDSQMTVTLIEKSYEVLLGTSAATPGRMGLGFHYEHLETAIAYLHATIEFAQKFPLSQFSIGREEPGGFLQRGRYFIVKDSFFTPEKILHTYEKIKQEYKRLVEEDPANQIFGAPEKIFRILDKSEYENDVDVDRVAVGIETAECLLDFPRVRKYLIEELKELQKKSKLKIYTQHSADKFRFDSEYDQYVVTCTDHRIPGEITSKNIYADFVVNATWEFIEGITQNAGLTDGLPKDGRTNRLKVLAEVELPESLKKKNSMFFCMGPHCMFSNIGNGNGLMSYAPNTNVDSSTKLYVPPRIEKFTREKRSRDSSEQKKYNAELERKKFGEKIIEGVTKYIPEMKNAKLKGLHFGIVKTTGEVDIFDHTSQFHIRNYSGVEPIALGWINNASMKLLYGLNNSETVFKHISNQIEIKRQLPSQVETSFSEKNLAVDRHKQNAVVKTVKRYFSHSQFFDSSPRKQITYAAITQMVEAATIKDAANKLIVGFKRETLKTPGPKEVFFGPQPLDRLKQISDVAIKKEAVEKAITRFQRAKLARPPSELDLTQPGKVSTSRSKRQAEISRSMSFTSLFAIPSEDSISENVPSSSSSVLTTITTDDIGVPKSFKRNGGI